MEILIERNNIRYLRREPYQKVEVHLQDRELRVLLYEQDDEPTVFIMIELATEADVVQVQQWLIQ